MGLVQYESSDEDEDAQVETPAQVGRFPLLIGSLA